MMGNDGGKWAIAFGFGGVGFVAGMLLGHVMGVDHAQSRGRGEAIKAGVARYEVDKMTGATKFVFGKRVDTMTGVTKLVFGEGDDHR